MKFKIFILVISITFMVATNMCNAARNSRQPYEIPVADIAIGGINLGTTESYVRSIYGEPDEISYDSNRLRAGSINRKTFRYGSTFFVVFNIDHHPKESTVWEVKSTGNNGLKTPVGFTVGMNLSDVRKYYGQGRGDENHLAYNANWWHNIMFTAKNGKITEIRIYTTP